MPTYDVCYAADYACYGTFEIEAKTDEHAIELAKHYEHGDVSLEVQWNHLVLQRIVDIQRKIGEIVEENLPLDHYYLTDGTKEAKHLWEAAEEMLAALKSIRTAALELAKERDPDQYGLWHAVFVPAENAIARAEGRADQ